MASASALPTSAMPSASCCLANFAASAARSASYFWASASFWRRYSSASACLRTSASSLRCWTSASWAARSTIFFWRAISASASDSLTSLARRFVWIIPAAFASAAALSASAFSLDFANSSSLLRWAMAVWASISFSFAAMAAAAFAQETSRSASALAMEARFFTSSSCSTPMASITPWLWPMASTASLTSCTLKVTTSKPILARSGRAFSTTLMAICLRFVRIWSTVISDTISRRLPCSTSLIFSLMCASSMPRKFEIADCWRELMYLRMSSYPALRTSSSETVEFSL